MLAKERQSNQQNDRLLQNYVDRLIRDDDAALPRNENIRQTLDVLHRQYGLVVDESTNSLSALVANVMNRSLQTRFKMETEGNPIILPPSRLLLRRIAQIIQATITIVSTRARTLVLKPLGESKSLIVLVHIANSFDSVSTYSPLTSSKTNPTQNLHPQALGPTPRPPTVNKAVYREEKRSTDNKPIDFSVKDAEECFLASWYVIRGCTELTMPMFLRINFFHFFFLKKTIISEETLKGRVKAAVNGAIKKSRAKKKTQADNSTALENAFIDLKATECGLKRLPRGLLQNAISNLEIRYDIHAGRISFKHFGKRLSVEQTQTIYREFVLAKIRLFWDCAVAATSDIKDQKVDSLHGDITSKEQDTPSQDQEILSKEQEIRVCDLPLHRILRKDFDVKQETRIDEILEQKQTSLSDHMDEVQVAVLKAHMEVRYTCPDEAVHAPYYFKTH
jgi:hypothetical protein